MRRTLPTLSAALFAAVTFSAFAAEQQPEGRSTVDPAPGASPAQQTAPSGPVETVTQPEGRSSTDPGAAKAVQPAAGGAGGGGAVTQPEGRASPEPKN